MLVCDVRRGVAVGDMLGYELFGLFLSRGDELGLIVACCADESGHCLVVDTMPKLAALSQHSGKWSAAAPTRAVWHMCDIVNCVAWKTEHDEVTAVMM